MLLFTALRTCFVQVRTFAELYLGDSRAARAVTRETLIDYICRCGVRAASTRPDVLIQACWERLRLMDQAINGGPSRAGDTARRCRLLPAEQRAVFIVRVFLHKSEGFTAKALDRSVGHIRASWHDAILTMQTLTATERSCA